MASNQLSTDYITTDFELFYRVVTLKKATFPSTGNYTGAFSG